MIYLFFLTFILALVVIWTIKNGISPMPSTAKAARAIFSLLPEVDGPVYELGSGWGHLLFPLCKKYTRNPVIGIENSPVPFWISKGIFSIYRKPNLLLLRKDFFDHPLDEAALIVCYLYPGAMHALRDKFERDLVPGTVVISHTFAVPGWRPEKVLTLTDLYQTKIYLYTVGQLSYKPEVYPNYECSNDDIGKN